MAQMLQMPQGMTRASLKERLAAYLKKHHSQSWLASGDLQRIVAGATKYTPQNVGRRLRELENDAVIEVRYVKGHAHYRYRAHESAEQLDILQLDWFER